MAKTRNGRGALIAFCGIDGCGKATQLKRTEKWLTARGHTAGLHSPFLTRHFANINPMR